jgi:hypothetical protein
LTIHVAAYALTVAGIVAVYRSLDGRSKVLGTLFLLGVIARVVAGGLLFVISRWELPVLSHLQSGDGFWTLAIDAQTYFTQASDNVRQGFPELSESVASPLFIRALAVSIFLYGSIPLAGAALNLLCYVCSIFLVSHARAGLPSTVFTAAALTFSPALLVFGTQPLKDALCVLLVTVIFYGLHWWSIGWRSSSPHLLHVVGGAGALVVATFSLAGIRSYYSAFSLVAFTTFAIAALWTNHRSRASTWAAHLLVIPILWLAFVSGAGASHYYYTHLLKATVARQSDAIQALDNARDAFIATGGGTALETRSDDPRTRSATVDGDPGLGVHAAPGRGRLYSILTGMAVLVVPISVLRLFSLVTFTGGRGLLLVTDVDTVLNDVTILVAAYLVWRARASGKLPLVLFAIILAGVTAAAMAYVVTNFGTLFRLRLLVLAPIWCLPAFLSARELEGGAVRQTATG